LFTVTSEAAIKAKQLMEKEGRSNGVLRIGVQGGGCSGLNYVLRFDDAVKENDVKLEIEDLTVVCDPKSYQYLEDIELYYERNLLNGGLKFRNPNAKRSCSCGESFSL